MKIDAGSVNPGEIQNDWGTRQSQASSSLGKFQEQNSDRTTLSRDNAAVKSLVNQALATPEVRQNKVSELKQAVSSGTYKVDTQHLATAMLSSID